MNKIFFASLMLVSVSALAAGGGHGDDHIPLDKIGWQAANLGILVIAIFFLVRKSIVDGFAQRQKSFVDQSEKTKAALREAEAALKDIKSRLSDLETGEKASLERAQKEASVMLANIVKDAEAQVTKAKADAKLMIQAETLKAKTEISNLIFDTALTTTAQDMKSQSKKISDDSESSFLKQISQVKT